MFISADTMAYLCSLGLTGEQMVGLVRHLEADAQAAQPVPDARKVEKRERDAARMREKREAERASRDVAATVARDVAGDTLSEGSQGSLSPEPPNLPNPPNLSQEPPIVPQKSAQKPVRGAFERFWAEYPLKVGKRKAEDCYGRAWRRCETDDPEAEILGGLKRCKPLWEPEYIPHPTTWLNRDGWLDQLEPEDTGSGATGPPRLNLASYDAERARLRAQIEAEEAA